MAITDSTLKISIPVFNVKMQDGQIIDLELPEGVSLNDDVYALSCASDYWTGELKEGDLAFVDPNAVANKGDYVAIYTKGGSVPIIEQMALAYMSDSIGQETHPASNVLAVLSVRRPNGFVRTVECSKVDKVHKVVGKALLQ